VNGILEGKGKVDLNYFDLINLEKLIENQSNEEFYKGIISDR